MNNRYYFRIEFQARGAPHVHSLAWLKTKSGKPVPSLLDITEENMEEKIAEIEEYHDKIISTSLDDIDESEENYEELKAKVEKFQTHFCGFTCHKRKKTMTIKTTEGHGKNDGNIQGKELSHIPVCRLNFPRFPMRRTRLLLGFSKDESEEVVKSAKKDLLKIKKYLIRQTYVSDKQRLEELTSWQKLKNLDFTNFLVEVGFLPEEYINDPVCVEQAEKRYEQALRASIKGMGFVFPKRNTKDIFLNNFNIKLMKLIDGNHDIQYCADPYSVAQYCVGYLTKNESGMSILLRKIDQECTNLSEIEKINKLSSILDKHREVSIQECVYRILGLPMAKFSVKVKYLNTSHPHYRDGLLRRDLESLKESDSVFHPSPHQYYENRPQNNTSSSDEEIEDSVSFTNTDEIDWDNMCLAEWWADFEHFPNAKPKKNDHIMQNEMGICKSRSERAVLRYYLPYEDDIELARALCILFLPFRNEMSEIHEDDPLKVLAANSEVINKNRSKFENNHMINDLIKQIERDQEKNKDLESESEAEDLEIETTERHEIIAQHEEYDRQAASKFLASVETIDTFLDSVELRKRIASLNDEQRRIFDDVIERICDTDVDKEPFYLYIAGEAGTGKSYVAKQIIYAVRETQIKAGQDLEKPTVIVIAPTANAAFNIKGKTIESALHINMDRRKSFLKASQDRASLLAFQYEDVVLTCCDEISMVGTDKLSAINFRMQELATGVNKNKFMGSMSFLASGKLLF